MEIEKKVWPKAYQKIADGDKTFELRLANFKCRPGDTLILREWNPKTKEYTGRSLKKKATYVIRTKNLEFWPDSEIEKYGFQVIAFK